MGFHIYPIRFCLALSLELFDPSTPSTQYTNEKLIIIFIFVSGQDIDSSFLLNCLYLFDRSEIIYKYVTLYYVHLIVIYRMVMGFILSTKHATNKFMLIDRQNIAISHSLSTLFGE